MDNQKTIQIVMIALLIISTTMGILTYIALMSISGGVSFNPSSAMMAPNYDLNRQWNLTPQGYLGGPIINSGSYSVDQLSEQGKCAAYCSDFCKKADNASGAQGDCIKECVKDQACAGRSGPNQQNSNN